MISKIQRALGSIRFWYAVIMGVAIYLEEAGIIPNAIGLAVTVFSALGIGVVTIDKFRK
ncbi:MAG: hypothetical protein KKB31_04265 [Nanoarchaeota archaeon]|nr:hypothetical protein [Nanoarchaeota archaeon]